MLVVFTVSCCFNSVGVVCLIYVCGLFDLFVWFGLDVLLLCLLLNCG